MNKSFWLTIGAVIVVVVVLFSSFGEKVTGQNIKVMSCTDANVYFYPVCPKCKHVSDMYVTNLSSGEEHSTSYVCEKCFNLYDIEIKR